jgi:hypothetical protein
VTVISLAPMPTPVVRLGNGAPYPVFTAGRRFQTAGMGEAPYPVFTAGRRFQTAGMGASPGYAPYPVVTAGRRFQTAGMGNSPAYAPYPIVTAGRRFQTAGMGRHRGSRRRVGGYPRMGCCAGYPRFGSYKRRLGQNLWDDLTSLFTPNPGGGSVTVNGATTYVNSQGQDQSTPDPNAGASLLTDPGAVFSEDASGLASAATSTLASSPWTYVAIGAVVLVGGFFLFGRKT